MTVKLHIENKRENRRNLPGLLMVEKNKPANIEKTKEMYVNQPKI